MPIPFAYLLPLLSLIFASLCLFEYFLGLYLTSLSLSSSDRPSGVFPPPFFSFYARFPLPPSEYRNCQLTPFTLVERKKNMEGLLQLPQFFYYAGQDQLRQMSVTLEIPSLPTRSRLTLFFFFQQSLNLFTYFFNKLGFPRQCSL